MATIRGTNCLWTHPVPYVASTNQYVREAIRIVNDAVGFSLFVAKSDHSPRDYVEFRIVGDNSCSPIGCRNLGLQYINIKEASETFSCVHEMLHCLGFEHEQFHPEYAWKSSDLGETNQDWRVDIGDSARLAEKSSRPAQVLLLDSMGDSGRSKKAPADEGARRPRFSMDLSTAQPRVPKVSASPERRQGRKKFKTICNQAIYAYFLKHQSEMFLQGFLDASPEKSSSVVKKTALCDYDSVMMYPAFRDAAKDARLQDETIAISGTGLTENKILSAGDINVLKELYGHLDATKNQVEK